MNKNVVALCVLVALVAVAMGVSAHPYGYTNSNAVATGNMGPLAKCPKTLGDGFGFVVICPGHLQPNALGQSSMSIIDDVNNPVVMFYCQDLNEDDWCGGNPMILPPAPYGRDPVTGHRGEPWFAFCSSLTLQAPLSLSYKLPQEWADPVNYGGNWDPSVAIVFFMRGYAEGNPSYISCGLDSTNAPTHGFILHS